MYGIEYEEWRNSESCTSDGFRSGPSRRRRADSGVLSKDRLKSAGISRPPLKEKNPLTQRRAGLISDQKPTNNRRPMTPLEAAEFLGLDPKTITRWARQGYLPGYPMGE